MAKLKAQGIHAVFHYQSLHDSPFYRTRYDGSPLPQTERYSNRLLRLPMFVGLDPLSVEKICSVVTLHYIK